MKSKNKSIFQKNILHFLRNGLKINPYNCFSAILFNLQLKSFASVLFMCNLGHVDASAGTYVADNVRARR